MVDWDPPWRTIILPDAGSVIPHTSDIWQSSELSFEVDWEKSVLPELNSEKQEKKMKPKKFDEGRLVFKKEIIANLTDQEMGKVKAGVQFKPCWENLWTWCYCDHVYTGKVPE